MDLHTLTELEVFATPGPWRADITPPGPGGQMMRNECVVSEKLDGGITHLARRGMQGDRRWASDANLIAAARNALPALLAVAEAAAEVSSTGAVMDNSYVISQDVMNKIDKALAQVKKLE
jgi:hypothetical protein